MNIIFEFLNLIGIPNIGLAIILFTIVIYLLMMPLTIKQQRMSKFSAKINPELQVIRNKYAGKQDQESMMAMNTETNRLYAKYGVSPAGSCLQLLIQMPVLIALYRVIYEIPAYVNRIGEAFGILADKIMQAADGVEYIQSLSAAAYFAKNFNIEGNTRNAIIDTLNKVSTTEMATLSEKFGLSELTYNGSLILSNGVERGLLDTYNNFLGLNMANSPSFTMKDAFSTGSYLVVAGALMIPLLAAFTQWINTKLMPQANANSGNETADSMAQSMKMMNTMMPLMSAFFCFTLPAGMGLYWIAGAVVRSIQQVLINKHIDKMDIEEVIKKNEAKAKKKIEKMNEQYANLAKNAGMNTKTISSKASVSNSSDKEEALQKAVEYSKNAKPGSIAAKANMVREYNEKNNK